MQAGIKAGESLIGLDELLGGSEGALAQLRLAARRIERGAAEHELLAEALAALDRALAIKPERHAFAIHKGAVPALSRHMSVTGG